MPAVRTRPRVGVVKLTSCDGCQLTLLDLEDELLAIVERFDIVDFPEATSVRSDGPYDVLFVEGSISAPEQVERLRELRARTTKLVAIGACATAGGIQACNGCEGALAKRLGADQSMVGVVTRVNRTEFTLQILVRDAATGAVAGRAKTFL